MSSTKNISSCSDDNIEIRRGPWTLDEDELLIKYVANHGEGRWNMLAKHSGLKRTGKSCRLRWLNYLKPDVKRGNLSPQEQLVIFELHSKWGNRWSKIALHLPGRTDNEIKNYWRTRVQKQARHLKIDSNSIEFQKIIKLLWIPHLLQKVKGSSSSSLVLEDQNQNMPLLSNQYSESATPTQIPMQGHCSPCMYETVPNTDQHDPHSDLKHNTSSYISAESINTISHMSGHPDSQLQIMCNSESSTFPNSHCYKRNDVYSIDTFNLATTTSAAEGFEFPVGDCQVTENNWIDKDYSEYLQNIDELWQI